MWKLKTEMWKWMCVMTVLGSVCSIVQLSKVQCNDVNASGKCVNEWERMSELVQIETVKSGTVAKC